MQVQKYFKYGLYSLYWPFYKTIFRRVVYACGCSSVLYRICSQAPRLALREKHIGSIAIRQVDLKKLKILVFQRLRQKATEWYG